MHTACQLERFMHFHFLPPSLPFALKSSYLPTTRFEIADATFQGV